MELEQQYLTYLYLETMPNNDPSYKYCYQTSSDKIAWLDQSVDNWLRAVVIHMSQRKQSHGGEKSNAIIITPPDFTVGQARDNWITYQAEKLRKKVRVRKVKAIK